MDEQCKRIQEDVNNIEANTGWNQHYSTIRQESSSYDYPCTEARSSNNKPFNRYRDVSPFDHSRVILNSESCNYINASFVKVAKAGRNYILTQGPLPNTAGHFWLMVWEQKSKAVLMLNKIIEKNQIKCHQYWPVGSGEGGSDTMVFQDVGLQVTLISERKSRHFIIRTLSIEELSTKNTREVLQFHYVTWPDFGVPSTPRAFLHFLQEVRDSGALSSKVGPPVVHCSAGIGRSGTFCLVDSCLLMMENGLTVNVKDVLLEMRKFRMGLIQTSDQLRFSYMAILEGAQQMADGNTRFAPDDTGSGLIIEEEDRPKPVPPRRGASLPPPPSEKDFEKYLQRHIVQDLPIIADRPLPDIPASSSDESSDSDVIDEDDSESEVDDIDLEQESSISEPKQIDSADESVKESSHIVDHSEKDANNGHAKPNGVDENVRRRTKNEITMDKIREIKQRQKESERKAELYQRLIRSPVPKRRKSCSSSDVPPDEN